MSKTIDEGSLRNGEAKRAVYGTYSLALLHSATTSRSLAESWKRPKRHNRAIERRALYSALFLDQECRTALATGRAMPPPSVASVEARYDVHAAIQTVHTVLPFTLAERDVLTPPEMLSRVVPRNPQFEDEAAVPDKKLLERWHEWLWMDENDVPQSSVEALGASAILGEACIRLYETLPEVVEGIKREL